VLKLVKGFNDGEHFFSMNLYLSLASYRVWMKKAMGCSSWLSSFYVRTATMLFSVPYVFQIKSFEKYRFLNIGVDIIANYIYSKVCTHFDIHFKYILSMISSIMDQNIMVLNEYFYKIDLTQKGLYLLDVIWNGKFGNGLYYNQ